MSDETTFRLALPLIAPAQAQKHVTHNEALAALDAAVQLVLEATAQAAPPEAPAPGTVWGIGAGAGGAWAGQDGRLAAAMQGGGWLFLDPAAGWRGWDRQAGGPVVHDGAAWTPEIPDPPQTLPRLGLGTPADAVNRLAVASAATLLTHDGGGGHQLKLNKAAPGDTAALLLQTGYSGRAEIGTAGDDDLSIKVSADGAAWRPALRIAAATGAADLAPGATIGGTEALHRGHLLGPVAFAGGQPAGAVIERGAGADGTWVRLADGTQICTARHEIRQGLPALLNAPWTYPAAFAATPMVQATLDLSDFAATVTGPSITEVGALTVNNATPQVCTPRLFRIEGMTDFAPGDMAHVHLLAVGRWI